MLLVVWMNGLEMPSDQEAYIQITIEQQNDVTWQVEARAAGPAGAKPQVPSPECCPNVRRIASEWSCSLECAKSCICILLILQLTSKAWSRYFTSCFSVCWLSLLNKREARLDCIRSVLLSFALPQYSDNSRVKGFQIKAAQERNLSQTPPALSSSKHLIFSYHQDLCCA